jgi:uncharacterized protein with FMN-binding domain
MKKFVLSMFVLASFGAYVIWQNFGNASGNLPSLTAVIQSDNNTQKNIKFVAISPTTTSTPTPKKTPISTSIPKPKPTGQYNDGEYTGDSVDAYYGNVEVKAIISGGKLADIQFLDYPQDRGTSVRINSNALPILRQEAIAAQSANVNGVSGASETSPAFIQSLASALNQAKA